MKESLVEPRALHDALCTAIDALYAQRGGRTREAALAALRAAVTRAERAAVVFERQQTACDIGLQIRMKGVATLTACAQEELHHAEQAAVQTSGQ